MKQMLYTLSVVALMPFYQNMDLISAEFVNLSHLDEEKRNTHAMELLGLSFFGSEADHASRMPLLNQHILSQFKKKLPKAYKSKAMELTNTLIEEANKEGVDPVLIMAVISTESGFRPWVKGTSGELGLMQILPSTAAWISKKTGVDYRGPESLKDPKMNITVGVRYISYLRQRFQGEGHNYLAAYNMGSRNVRRLLAQNIQPRIYSDKVLNNYKRLYSNLVIPETKTISWQVAAH